MPMFAKLNSIRSSVHFPFLSNRRSSHFRSNPPYTHHSKSTATITQPQPQPPQPTAQRHRTVSTPTTNFAETLRVISRQMQQDQYDDVFNSFFYTDKRCVNRAIFFAARLEQTLGNQSMSFWHLVMDRLYTLNYLLYVIPSTNQTRTNYLAALDQHMHDTLIGRQLQPLCGGLETYFAFSQDAALMEQARKILEHCIKSENKLGHAERDAMYIFHGLRSGFHGRYEPKVVMEDDDVLLALLQNSVRDNKNLSSCVNPFEDGACIVDDD
ncbi:hypothetical protein BC941DRAFT_213691 [Chlamydoabsidia padenii]|nr:hypothetical protein BC941DRAFT_213691 [Chlamydoabsidia padenii]